MENVYFYTFGCAVNKADSEVMAGILENAGFKITNRPEKADVIIINTCTVKGPSESNFRKKLHEFEKLKKKLIIAGCLTQADPSIVKQHSIIGVDQIHNIVEVVEETMAGSSARLLVKEKFERLNLNKKRLNPIIEIIPVSQGCLGKPCAYCKVKQARGDLISYPPNEIIKHAKRAVANGAKELWLTAQDMGCYGYDFDNEYRLPDLLHDINLIQGHFLVRVGMANPNFVYEYLDKLIEAYKSSRIFKYLHIPVQSGSNEILKSMRRDYTVRQFETIVKAFRNEFPEINICTDIICGFPGETDNQFEKSISLINRIRPDELNISKFWARSKTEAARMTPVPGSKIKTRSSRMSSLFDFISYSNNKKWRGWKGFVIIDEHGKNETYVGRNYAYKPVIVEGKHTLGSLVEVNIHNTTTYDLRAEIIKKI